MEGKVLYVNLLEDVKYRKVIVTQDSIPKPKPLIGAAQVYQKEGLPYWFCKIKNGRDEFMHLCMEDLTHEDLLYDYNTGNLREFKTKRERDFKKEVLESIIKKPKSGYCWIPVYEPSESEEGGIQFIPNEEPKVGLNCYEWKKIFKEYSPENRSCISSKYTYFLLQLRWLKDGIATLQQLTGNPKDIGHCWDSKDAKHCFEKTGQREFGGLYGFVGNTCKIVQGRDSNSSFYIVGTNYSNFGDICPLCFIIYVERPYKEFKNSVGLLELQGG